MDKARETALKALMDIELKEGYSNLVLKRRLGSNVLDARDRAFVTELVYGVVTRQLTLDWIISRFSRMEFSKLSPWVVQILRMGIYQILFLDRVPPSAACNTSVELAKKTAGAASGFVNGILRNVSRRRDEIRIEEAETGSVAGNLSVCYSFPQFLAERWLDEFGEEFTARLLASLLERPDFSVRVNTLKTTRDDLICELREEGIEARPGRFLEEALVLGNVSDVSRSKAFRDGKMTVQDESSMLAVRVLDPKPGERILDVCAAPGGKTTHIGQLMKNEGTIIAWDVHEHKADLIRDNAGRLGITNIETVTRDALLPVPGEEGRYHRVLVDAPCSGTGIIRRKPDIKWRRKQEDFGSLVEIQRKILYNASRYVVPGGVLVYSTCSMDGRENTQVVLSFLEENTHFEPDPLEPYLPKSLAKETNRSGMLSLFPHIDGTDGFFIARMKRKG